MIDLLTPRQAAAELKISVKTLRLLVAAGALRYVQIGVSDKRPRKMFTPGDLETFISNQTRRDAPLCPSTRTCVRRAGNTTSSGEVIGFAARLAREAAEKRKLLSVAKEKR